MKIKTFPETIKLNHTDFAVFNHVKFCRSGNGIFQLFDFANPSKDPLI